MNRRYIAVIAAVLSPATVLAAALVEIAFDADGRFDHEGRIAPGKFLEVCAPMPPGQGLHWSFRSDALVDFNIHYHVGGKVESPVRRTGVEAMDGDFVAPSGQDYCWMWKNTGVREAIVGARFQRR